MRRFAACWSLLTVLSLGCGPTTSTNTIPATSAPTAPTASTVVTTAPRTISAAAAADLKYALDEIVQEFQRKNTDIVVETSYGASGKLYAQLCNQAPFDLFFSADIGFPQKLIDQEFAEQQTLFRYAIGHVGLWVGRDSPLAMEEQGVKILLDPTIQKIAIANPQTAPYGRAAEAALKYFEIHGAIKDKLVLGENVAQTLQFVESGAADIGLVAQSLALSSAVKGKGRFLMLPAESHPALEQGAVILKWARDRAACDELRAFVTSTAGRTILARHGFDLPPE